MKGVHMCEKAIELLVKSPRLLLTSRSLSSLKLSGDHPSKRNELFDAELRRQQDIGRIEKIEVTHLGKSENNRLLMNKGLSTPFHVARHLSEWAMQQSALAVINDTELWDMHRPLESDCTLKFLTFTDADPFHVNKAFWRTCSFLLGCIVQNAFSDGIQVVLHSFPSPSISSGSFVYDASLSLEDWSPKKEELRVLSAEMIKLALKSLPIERLQISQEIAEEMFSDNHFKLKQIPDIAKTSDGSITVYRVGTHIDISKGPMIGNSGFLGRCSITAVNRIESDDGPLTRFQGVALPKGLLLNHFAYQILEERASKLNSHRSHFKHHKLEQLA